MKKILSTVLVTALILALIPVFGVYAEVKTLPLINGNFETDAVCSPGAYGNTITGWTQRSYIGGNSEDPETAWFEPTEETYSKNVLEYGITSTTLSGLPAIDGKALQLKASEPKGGSKTSNLVLSEPVAIPEKVKGTSKNYTLSFRYGTIIQNTRIRGGLIFMKTDEEQNLYIYNDGWKLESEAVATQRFQLKDADGKNGYVELTPGANGAAAVKQWGTATVTAKAPADTEYVQVALALHVGAAQRVLYDNVVVTYDDDIVPPADVANLSLEALNKKINVSWENPSDTDYEKALVYVEAAGAPIEGSPFTVPASENSISIENLTNNTEYTVKVVAYDASSNASAGVSGTATPVAPAVNTPPEVVNPVPDTEIWADEKLSLDISNVFEDVNHDSFTVTTSLGTLVGNILSYDPEGVSGEYTVVLSANDGTDVGEDSFILTVKAVPNEKPVNEGNKYYLNVVNPGFDRTTVPAGGQTDKSANIIGWTRGTNPAAGISTTGERLYSVVRNNIDGSSKNALFHFDQDNTNGLIEASDLIPLDSQSLAEQVAYTVNYKYKIGFNDVDGKRNGYQFGTAITFYDENGRIWVNSTWSNTYNKNSSIVDQFNNGKVISGGAGNGTYCHKWHTQADGLELSKWLDISDTRTAPKGAKYARIFFASSTGGGAYIFAIDSVKLSYTKKTAAISSSVLTNGEASDIGGTLSVASTSDYGADLEYTVTPNTGYVIDYVKVNNNVTDTCVTGSKDYVINNVGADQNIEVNFIADSDALDISSHPAAYTTEDEYYGKSGVVFARAKSVCGRYTATEYGVVLSSVSDKPEIGATGCEKYKGLVPVGESGNFGIRFFGSGIIPGITYHVRPYVIYSIDNSTSILYGDTVDFSLAE